MLAVTLGGPTSHFLSRALAAPLWSISGTVETKDGHIVANAPVGLTILPATPLPATPTPTVYIAQTVTGTDGSFSIPAPSLSPAVLAQAASNDGWLNFEVDSASELATLNGDAVYAGSTAESVLVLPGHVAAGPIGTVRSTPNGGVLILYGAKGDALSTASQTVTNLKTCVLALTECVFHGPGPAPTDPGPNCATNWYRINGPSNYYEPVGEFHTYQDMSGSYTYSQTASTNLGVGYNYNGNGWSVGGSVYIGNTTSATTGSGPVGAYYAYQQDLEFTYEMDENDNCGTQYRIYGQQWTGGSAIGDNVSGGDGPNKYWSVPEGDRANFTPGRPFGISQGHGFTYSFQVVAFGVTLNSETDYSSNVTMNWQMGNDTSITHSLFGYGEAPADPNVQLIFASTE